MQVKSFWRCSGSRVAPTGVASGGATERPLTSCLLVDDRHVRIGRAGVAGSGRLDCTGDGHKKAREWDDQDRRDYARGSGVAMLRDRAADRNGDSVRAHGKQARCEAAGTLKIHPVPRRWEEVMRTKGPRLVGECRNLRRPAPGCALSGACATSHSV